MAEFTKKSFQCLNVFLGYSEAINALAVILDGNLFIPGSADGTLKTLAFDKENCLKTFSDYADGVSADGLLISVGDIGISE
jgi:WD40 repeat protein